MPTNLKLRLVPRAALQARVSPRLTASIVESTGINVAYSGGIYTVSLDVASLTAKASVTAPEQDNLFLALYDSDGLTYSKLGLDVLAAAIGGGGGGGGPISDGDYGDITVSSSGTTFTIDDDVVTNAKLANMAQATVKGRVAGAGTGDPVDLNATQLVAIIATADGSGSGLDADMLDGNSSAFYAVASDLTDHISDSSDAHDASAISSVPAGNLSATDVQAALNELDAEKQPLDADLTAIAGLATTPAGRSVLIVADPGVDRLSFWDDSDNTFKLGVISDFNVEASPASGDKLFLQRAGTNDLAIIDWSDLPGASGGIGNVSEDTSPTLGGNLEGAGFSLGTSGSQAADLFLEEGGVINWDNGDATITQTGNDITVAGVTTFQLGTSTALTTGTIELGHASDTTLSRPGAGRLAVEGVDVILTTSIASQAQMEAASSTSVVVPPGRVQHHPGVVKVRAYVSVSGGTPTLVDSYNVSGIVDNGVGDLTITIGTDMSSNDYVAHVSANKSGSTDLGPYPYATVAGSIPCFNQAASGAGVDPIDWNVSALGDQA